MSDQSDPFTYPMHQLSMPAAPSDAAHPDSARQSAMSQPLPGGQEPAAPAAGSQPASAPLMWGSSAQTDPEPPQPTKPSAPTPTAPAVAAPTPLRWGSAAAESGEADDVSPYAKQSAAMARPGYHEAAVDMIRSKLHNVYGTEPSASEELVQVEQRSQHLSKHQQYMNQLNRSGMAAGDIQTAWHSYYQNLPEQEKHEVWQEFNAGGANDGNSVNSGAAAQPAHASPDTGWPSQAHTSGAAEPSHPAVHPAALQWGNGAAAPFGMPSVHTGQPAAWQADSTLTGQRPQQQAQQGPQPEQPGQQQASHQAGLAQHTVQQPWPEQPTQQQHQSAPDRPTTGMLRERAADRASQSLSGRPEFPKRPSNGVKNGFLGGSWARIKHFLPGGSQKQTSTTNTDSARRSASRPGWRGSSQLRSLLFGLACGCIAIFVFLFSFFNEVVIAPFYQPSRKTVNTPVIINTASTTVSADPKVLIPKINLEIPVDYSQTTTDEAQIELALDKGVVHYPTTSKPGEAGNTAFFGHSSNNIFNPGKYKFAFVLLHELVEGDIFYLNYNGKVYAYKVFSKKVVEPSEVSVLLPVAGHASTATLITCDPPGTSLHRLVVVGDQISPDANGNAAPVTAPVQTAVNNDLPGNGQTLWSRIWGSVF